MAITLYPSEKGNKSKTPKISSKSVIANNKIEITDKKYKNVNYGIQLLGEYRSKKKATFRKVITVYTVCRFMAMRSP